MTSAERFRLVDDLFRAALRLNPDERRHFVDEQCGSDAALKTEVIALLNEDAASGALDQPALGDPGSLARLHHGIDEPPLPLPEHIGRYRIIRVIGAGGMGIVYEAEQEHPRRRVALKVIRSGVASRQMLRRFRHEAHILGQLMHPGIAQIYEAGTADSGAGGQPYFAMELVQGKTLLQYASDHALGTRDRLDLMARICDAVQHAHERGVIHRDLKPANILVVDDATQSRGIAMPRLSTAQPKVLDFGVARATDADVQTITLNTDVGALIGTVAYMSPEQAVGDPTAVDARSDVYALGVILFELLGGRLPYEIHGQMIHESVRVIREVEPSRLSSIDRIFRGDIETIASRALEKDPHRRYQTAAALAADIRRYLAEQPIIARPPSALYQLRKFTRRNRKLVLGLGSGSIVAFGAMLVATIISLRQRDVAIEALELADARALQAEQQAYRAGIAAAAASLAQHDALSARKFLESAPPSRIDWEWRHLQAQLDDSTFLIDSRQTRPHHGIAAFLTSANPNELITLTRDEANCRIEQWDILTGKAKVIATLALSNVRMAVSAPTTHRFVALANADLPDATLIVIDARNGTILASVIAERVNRIAASADGSCIAGRGNGVAVLWRPTLDTGSPFAMNCEWGPHADTDQEVVALPCPVPHPAITMSDACRTVLVGQQSIDLIDSSPKIAASIGAPTQTVHVLAINADESLALTGDEFGTVKIYDATSAERKPPLRLIHAHAGPVLAALFLDESPDGKPGTRFITGGSSSDPTVRLWDTETGELLRVFVGCEGGVSQLGVSEDRTLLIAVDNRGDLRVWNLQNAESEPTTVLRGHSSYVYGVMFTADGTRLYTASWDRTVRAWDASSGAPLSVLVSASSSSGSALTAAPSHGFVTSFDLSPDGRWIATGHHYGLWSESEIRIWDAATGALLHDLPRHIGHVTCVRFSPDGQRLATVTRNSGLRVFALAGDSADFKSVVEVTELRHPRYGGWESAWSPDGRVIATSYEDGVVRIVDSSTGQDLLEWKAHQSSANFVLYSKDGSMLITASADALVKLWNATTGALMGTLEGHRAAVWCAALSPDESRLATGSADNTIRIWNFRSREPLLELRGHDDYVYYLAFSPDGRMLASASGDHTVRIWDTQPLRDRWRAYRLHGAAPRPDGPAR